MSKTLLFALSACLALTGCQSFRTSPIWKTIVHTHIVLPRDGDSSKLYAAEFHRELTAARIEHKVVTYQYRYNVGMRDEATATRTAVIYRDDTNPTYPWWLKDEVSNRPVWLPNGSVEQQIRFCIGREVQIVDAGHNAGGDGKEIIHSHPHAKKHVASSKTHTESSKKHIASSKKHTASSKKRATSSKKHTGTPKTKRKAQ